MSIVGELKFAARLTRSGRLPGSFSLLRRFGVQSYTERPYHLENGIKVGTAFAYERSFPRIPGLSYQRW
jgi:hypothetical protein